MQTIMVRDYNNFENMTLEQIKKFANKVVIEKDSIKMQKITPNQVSTIENKQYKDTNITTISNTDMPKLKKDLKETILPMLTNGIKQKDIAFKLNVSQTLVSNIKTNKL
ncbi:hypothetical protein DWV13_16890 [Clostridium botulinum]|uniref:hypothetical protein n=1 Tax=Clostridium TaxID=1485 RepID=UPI0013F8D773|nr:MULTISPECIES: hypothetical protein [Clostridium]MCS6133265.1 hypothetical protein [Clostridium botulinum]NFL46730.1 hypothetical protein [Clostridium botulinum]NFL91170.1 hypothetical protein [Clostridium botulinum]